MGKKKKYDIDVEEGVEVVPETVEEKVVEPVVEEKPVEAVIPEVKKETPVKIVDAAEAMVEKVKPKSKAKSNYEIRLGL